MRLRDRLFGSSSRVSHFHLPKAAPQIQESLPFHEGLRLAQLATSESACSLLTAAEGYVELGMFLDANAELEDTDPEVRAAPPVVEVRLKIFRGLEKWELMQPVAQMLALDDPKNPQWALALSAMPLVSMESCRYEFQNARRH